MLLLIFFVVLANKAGAHELWVLTPDQVLEWNGKPKPSIYTSITLSGFAILAIALAVNLTLFHLDANGARELFPMFRARMRSLRKYTSVILRFCLGWVLISSALALEPRYGNTIFTEPTLLAPDLVISQLPPSTQWLRWFEVTTGIAIVLGIYTRLAALCTISLAVFALVYLGVPAIAYAPSFIGVSAYLFFAGSGALYIPMPVPTTLQTMNQRLAHTINLGRAQFLLRILVGANFLYLAVYFKVIQPNLAMAIIDVHQLPTMGFSPETFVLILAATEVSIGLLIVAGVVLRFLSFILIAAFLFFSLCLTQAEYLTSHLLYYGVAVSFLFNGSGRWRFKPASDKSTRITILGNGLAAISAARRLESILPEPSNVKVTLVSNTLDYQFKSMLPEVVSGTVQPTSVVSPLVRTLVKTEVILAEAELIDFRAKCLVLCCPDHKTKLHHYDQLIYAVEPGPNHSLSPNRKPNCVFYLDNIADALRLKQHILNQASSNSNEAPLLPDELGFAIVGGGQHGSALAMEIRSLLNRLRVERQISQLYNPKVVVFESESEIENIDSKLLNRRNELFNSHEIGVVNKDSIERIDGSGIVLKRSGLIEVSTVVNLNYHSNLDSLQRHAGEKLPDIEHDLSLSDPLYNGTWVVSLRSMMSEHRPSYTIAQGRKAATNAWARSQGLPTTSFVQCRHKTYELYMGHKTITSWCGVKLPAIISRVINRVRFLSLLPTFECKVRLLIDELFSVFFGNSTSDLGSGTPTNSNTSTMDKTQFPEHLSENKKAA
ncbi:hypothetical protein AB833_18540 [Chromatiales bacterium (ex Bugula neritina AB1)]|nr:hypothetical protein AB833_18540 [Chromatiales bacterium (ex Bugula neritina AB1)]